jgi:hypothetical protein
MSRILLIAVVTTALALAASAAAGAAPRHAPRAPRVLLADSGAARGPAAGNLLALATSVAERYWGAAPCAGRITLRSDAAVPAGLDPSTDGWVTFESSLGANNLQAPPSTYSGCTITLAHWQWPTLKAMRSDWNMLCLTVTHELGHLLGRPHSLAAGSVMAPVFTGEASVPGICRASRARAVAAVARPRRS